jgi:hypothetical protein
VTDNSVTDVLRRLSYTLGKKRLCHLALNCIHTARTQNAAEFGDNGGILRDKITGMGPKNVQVEKHEA